jgi:hypothetical protein
VVGKVAPHGYGIMLSEFYYELLARRQRYPAKGSYSFRYWGDDNTIRFSLLRQAMHPETRREEYIQLGLFEFDCVPMGGTLHFSFDWEYTDNGLLHLEVTQPGGVSMPLYDVSRLDGHAVSRPRRRDPNEQSVEPETQPPRRSWSGGELQQAVRFGQSVLEMARSKLELAKGEPRAHLERLTGQLAQWLDDETADPDSRTPHVRDLGRSLVNLLHVSRLIDAKELTSLKQNL